MPATRRLARPADVRRRARRRARWPVPTAARLAFGRDVGGNERDRLYLAEPGAPAGGRPTPSTRSAPSRPDGTLLAFTHTERNGTDFDLAILDLATGERREARSWRAGTSSATSPRTASCTRAPGRTCRTTSTSPTRRAASRALLTAHEGPEQYLPARLCDDGTVLCGCDRGSEYQRLTRLRADGSLEFLTDDDADVEDDRRARRPAWRTSGTWPAPRGWCSTAGRSAACRTASSAASRSRPDGRRLALHVAPADGADRCVRRRRRHRTA